MSFVHLSKKIDKFIFFTNIYNILINNNIMDNFYTVTPIDKLNVNLIEQSLLKWKTKKQI